MRGGMELGQSFWMFLRDSYVEEDVLHDSLVGLQRHHLRVSTQFARA